MPGDPLQMPTLWQKEKDLCIQAQPLRYRRCMVFGGGMFLSPDAGRGGPFLRLSSLGTIRKQRDSERAWGLGSSCALSQFYSPCT